MSTNAQEVANGVSRETMEDLQQFSALLLKWNAKINLMARSQETNVWTRHIADSLQLVEHIPVNCKVLTDIGSGGGLPGIVIAIAAKQQRPEMHVQLVESDQRKAAFLSTVVRTLNLNAKVFAQRIDQTTAIPADCMTARALASLSDLLGFAEQRLSQNGVAVLPKGQNAKSEIAAARMAWHFSCRSFASKTDPAAKVLVVKDIARV